MSNSKEVIDKETYDDVYKSILEIIMLAGAADELDLDDDIIVASISKALADLSVNILTTIEGD